MTKAITLSIGLTIMLVGIFNNETQAQNSQSDMTIPADAKTEQITLGAGCFWCVEAVFQDLKGVYVVESGYMGGEMVNPTYEEVSTGKTGHNEVARITFNPGVISLETLLEVFWTTHDPTTMNRQGNDRGTQYRSAIYYSNNDQKAAAESSMSSIAPRIWDQKIVTEITKASTFYPAENYHQDYYNKNPNAGYCVAVINPKVQKARKQFSHLQK